MKNRDRDRRGYKNRDRKRDSDSTSTLIGWGELVGFNAIAESALLVTVEGSTSPSSSFSKSFSTDAFDIVFTVRTLFALCPISNLCQPDAFALLVATGFEGVSSSIPVVGAEYFVCRLRSS